MKTLKVEQMGTEVQGVHLRGDPRSPEPMSFRVCFPGGEVELTRASDGAGADYWVHVRVTEAKERGEEQVVRDRGLAVGRLVDARLDVRSKHASETDVGDFRAPDLYHLAVRIHSER